MNATLTPESEAILEKMLASGVSSDKSEVIHNALCLYEHKVTWLHQELEKGEQSGEAVAYTQALLDRLEQEVLNEIEAGNLEIDPTVWLQATD